MVSLEEAEAHLRLAQGRSHELVETGRELAGHKRERGARQDWHYSRDAQGSVLVCAHSLLRTRADAEDFVPKKLTKENDDEHNE